MPVSNWFSHALKLEALNKKRLEELNHNCDYSSSFFIIDFSALYRGTRTSLAPTTDAVRLLVCFLCVFIFIFLVGCTSERWRSLSQAYLSTVANYVSQVN